jgi:hypothetical protein
MKVRCVENGTFLLHPPAQTLTRLHRATASADLTRSHLVTPSWRCGNGVQNYKKKKRKEKCMSHLISNGLYEPRCTNLKIRVMSSAGSRQGTATRAFRCRLKSKISFDSLDIFASISSTVNMWTISDVCCLEFCNVWRKALHSHPGSSISCVIHSTSFACTNI